MKKIIPISFLIFLSFISSIAQERIDVIYLKNGDILKGEIIENAHNDYIRIELQGGSIFTVKYIDILNIKREKPDSSNIRVNSDLQTEKIA